jgi:hypothetical protein
LLPLEDGQLLSQDEVFKDSMSVSEPGSAKQPEYQTP